MTISVPQIESALDAERFELYLQPIRSLHAPPPAQAHYEVLLRLRIERRLADRAEAVLQRRRASQLHALDRSLGGAHAPQWLVNNRRLWSRTPAVFSINVLLAIDDRRPIRELRRDCMKQERLAAAGAVLRDHGTLRLLRQHQRGGVDDAASRRWAARWRWMISAANAPRTGICARVPAHYFKIDRARWSSRRPPIASRAP